MMSEASDRHNLTHGSWNHLEGSSLTCVVVDGSRDLRWGCWPEHVSVASLCDLGFLTARLLRAPQVSIPSPKQNFMAFSDDSQNPHSATAITVSSLPRLEKRGHRPHLSLRRLTRSHCRESIWDGGHCCDHLWKL